MLESSSVVFLACFWTLKRNIALSVMARLAAIARELASLGEVATAMVVHTAIGHDEPATSGRRKG